MSSFKSSCIERLAIAAYQYDAESANKRIPYQWPLAVAASSDEWPKAAYPDDVLSMGVNAVLSMPGLDEAQQRVIKVGGYMALLAAHLRAIRKHGYSNSAEERVYCFDQSWLSKNIGQAMADMRAIMDEIATFEAGAK